MNVRFETDQDGFLSQECPSCRQRFKVLFDEESGGTLSFCPYCRHTGEDNWLTEEQLEYVHSVANDVLIRPELERLSRQIAKLSNDIIDIQVTESTNETAKPPVETVDDFDSIYFACCAETIKAQRQDTYYCIICGKEQEEMMGERVFLSHKGSDKRMVLEYKEVLDEMGFKPWLDDEAMVAGTSLERGLLKGMQESCAVVFFITPDFKDSGFLETEINYAVAEKRKKGDKFAIIVLILEESGAGSDNGSIVPDLLRPYVWKQPESHLKALVEILRALPRVDRRDNATIDTRSPLIRQAGLELSEDGKLILMAAARGGGEIICIRTMGGLSVSAGGESMTSDHSPREAARWEAAIEELQRHRYIKGLGHKGEIFDLTKAGWDLADSLLEG